MTMTPAAHRILDAASELYYDRGINSVGMDLVAEQAGTTKKTIYDRFGSKDGLVVAYLEARAEPLAGARREAPGHRRPPPVSTGWSP